MYVCAFPFSNWSLFSDFYQAEEEPFTKDWMVIERRGGLRQTTVTSGNTNDQNNKRTEIQMRLAGGIGISLINGVPEELVFATFNPIEVSVTTGWAGQLRVRKLINKLFFVGYNYQKIYNDNFDVSCEGPNSARRAFAGNVEILLIYFHVVASLPTKACSYY